MNESQITHLMIGARGMGTTTQMMEKPKFILSKNHSYFFTRNNNLYEVVTSLRGDKVKHRLELESEPDCDHLSEEDVKSIEIKYLK